MKQIILLFFLLFQLIMFSQADTNISVVSLEKVNTVYRGITNPVKVAVPKAKSFKVEALGVLTKVDSLGNYYWNVTGIRGRKANIKIDIVMPDNTVIHEEKEFEIKEIKSTRGVITSGYSNFTYEMTHEQLTDLRLGITIDDLYIKRDSLYATPVGFELSIPGKKDIIIEGNSMNEEAKLLINELPLGSVVYIKNIYQYNPNSYLLRSIPVIKIRIVDGWAEEINVPKPIISLKHRNILYRGISNELEITVPGAKSFNVSASGLIEDKKGSYSWNVSKIKTSTALLNFEIVTENDSVFQIKEEFWIKDKGTVKATINGNGCNNCIVELTKEDIKDAKIDIKFEDFFDNRWLFFYVKEYMLELPDGNLYRVGEDGFSHSAQKMIVQFPNGSIFKIKDIKYLLPNCDYCNFKPEIKFMLVDNHN